jgi:hypothetical protein
MKQTCAHCGKDFEITGHRFHAHSKRYCSQSCASQHSWKKKADGKTATVTKKGLRYGDLVTCACGKEFVSHWRGGKYCSRRCAAKHAPKDEKKLQKNFTKKLKLQTLDLMAREICRRRGVCEAAGEDGVQCSGSLQWAHIMSRTYHKVRWDDDNCFFMCAAHHMFYTNRTVHWRRFLERKIGLRKIEELEGRALAEGKVDRIEIYRILRDKLKDEQHVWLWSDCGEEADK